MGLISGIALVLHHLVSKMYASVGGGDLSNIHFSVVQVFFGGMKHTILRPPNLTPLNFIRYVFSLGVRQEFSVNHGSTQ